MCITEKEKYRQKFWDNKILEWEFDKYHRTSLVDVNSSVRLRRTLALRNLCPLVANKKIIEIGCGSGELISSFLESGAKEYIGVDVSERALEKARERVIEYQGSDDRVTLIHGDVTELELPYGDICFSLGFLDWISGEEVQKIAKNISADIYLHSFSESMITLHLMLHRIYVFLRYGYKRDSYTPNYYKQEFIINVFSRATGALPLICANPKLSFGRLVHNLPNFVTPYDK